MALNEPPELRVRREEEGDPGGGWVAGFGG